MTEYDVLKVLEIIEKYKLRTNPTVYYELKADICDLEEQENKEWNTNTM